MSDGRFILEDETPAARFVLEDAPVSVGKRNPLQEARDAGMSSIEGYKPTDTIAGAVRGSGSIGATLLRPFESASDNQQRRAGMDSALSTLGADPTSSQFQASKLGAELAGTSGMGGLLAKGLQLIPGAAKALPTLLPAIESGGMSANGATGLYGMLNRIAGGAVTGAATAGAAEPQNTKEGMLFGAALPPVVKVAGAVGNAIGGFFNGKPINPTLQQTARESVDAGYVIPPNMVKPGLGSQVVESISGKQATQQVASLKNNEVTEKIVKESLGLPQDAQLTQSTLEGLRKTAGKAYAEVSSLSPQASADLEALKIARNESEAWFKAYNRSASPVDLAKAKQLRSDAEALEHALEAHAQAANKPELIPALRNARKEIAKTYTVGRAINDASGTVDARVIGRMYEKGMPLSDGLEVAGKFASAFPTISKSTQQVGSPAAHNLKSFGSLLLGSGGYAAMGPAGAAAAAVPFIAPPLARSIMFSGPMQRSMVAQPSGPGILSQSIDELLPLAYRNGGLLATSGR
jgi:hypothetical protein